MPSETPGDLTQQNNNDLHHIDSSQKETKSILTPFAFTIDKSLFGLPLALPRKRALALLIDLFFIVLLSETPSQLLAFFAALSAYKLGLNPNKTRPKKYGWLRKLTRLISALIVFSLLITSLPFLTDKFEHFFDSKPNENNQLVSTNVHIGDSSMSVTDAITTSLISAKIISAINNNECVAVECWHEFFGQFITEYAALSIDKETAKEAIKSVVEQTKLTQDEKFFLNASLYDEYINQLNVITRNKNKTVDPQSKHELNKSTEAEPIKSSTPTYSFMKYIKGLIDDLGLGFGWAALYFTMFTAYWHGQTPGKKLLSIKVVQLDGTPLSVIDSFGRYGGYGAGIATGLLGFFQIYWDPNRQCIHDKIVSTVVIDLKRKNNSKGF